MQGCPYDMHPDLIYPNSELHDRRTIILRIHILQIEQEPTMHSQSAYRNSTVSAAVHKERDTHSITCICSVHMYIRTFVEGRWDGEKRRGGPKS